MITLAYIIGYIVIPFVVYNVNDYAAGYFRDRLEEDLSFLDGLSTGKVFSAFVFWPFVFIAMFFVWSINILKCVIKKLDSDKFPSMSRGTYAKGIAKRKRELDLDYQAEKYLLGKK